MATLLPPVTVPPQPERVYDSVWCPLLQVRQPSIGSPVTFTFVLRNYTIVNGVPKLYPAVEGNSSRKIEMTLQQIAAKPRIVELMAEVQAELEAMELEARG